MKYFAYICLISASQAIHHRAQDVFDSDLMTGLYQKSSVDGKYRFRYVMAEIKEEPESDAVKEAQVKKEQESLELEAKAEEVQEKKQAEAKKEAEAKEQAEDAKDAADEAKNEAAPQSDMAWVSEMPEKWITHDKHSPLKWVN